MRTCELVLDKIGLGIAKRIRFPGIFRVFAVYPEHLFSAWQSQRVLRAKHEKESWKNWENCLMLVEKENPPEGWCRIRLSHAEEGIAGGQLYVYELVFVLGIHLGSDAAHGF